MKKVTDEIVKAFDSCVNRLSLHEMSRRTGIGIYTLRKFATRQTDTIREETWDKIYPVLRPYLDGPESVAAEPPPSAPGPRTPIPREARRGSAPTGLPSSTPTAAGRLTRGSP